MSSLPFNPCQPHYLGTEEILRQQQQCLLHMQQLHTQQSAIKSISTSTGIELGRLITLRRNEMGGTYDNLTALTGISTMELMQIEAGQGEAVSLEKALQVMAALRLNIHVHPC